MIELTPTNMSDYFVPSGDGFKISEYNNIPKFAVNTFDIGAAESVEVLGPVLVKKDNSWIYVLVGVGIIVGGIYAWHKYKGQEEEKNYDSKMYVKT